jgi:hypothetical protein
MAKEIENDDGTKETYYSPAEVEAAAAAKAAEIATAKDAEIAATKAELERISAIHGAQSDNFKKYKDMTEEEKGKLTASETAERIRADKLQEDLEALKGTIDADKQASAAAAKEALIKQYCGDDKDLRAKFEKNMGIIQVDNLEEKAAAAAALTGIARPGQMNPLHVHLMGDAPGFKKEQNEKKEFLESDKAKAAMAAMGDVPKAQ